MKDVPHSGSLDSTVAAWREGYEFIQRRTRQLQSDVFRGRLLGKPALFMTGAAAAELFYDPSRFQRAGAVPLLVQKTLFGTDGVQVLDDEVHRERKAMFMALMARESLSRFSEIAEKNWSDESGRWPKRGRVVLFEAARDVLCRSACEWTGATLGERRLGRLARDCAAMVDGFASVGLRALRARRARRRSERWAARLIRDIRDGSRYVELGTAAQVFAERRQASGARLPEHAAAVELLNLIRPITALSWWVSFMVLPLRDVPSYRERLAADEAFLESFVQEVRRFYPFTPFLGAKARLDFDWRGIEVRQGDLVILDVYGTLRDPRIWTRPDEFLPERFLGRQPTPFDFIPNGGGDFGSGHRCAGEWLSIEALKQAARLLGRDLQYELPRQRLDYSLARIPTRPESGVVLERVRVTAPRRVLVKTRSSAPGESALG